jgi:hypothetical protein
MLTRDLEIDQKRCIAQEQAGNDWFFEGRGDWEFRIQPQFLNPEYLRGWFAGLTESLQELPRDRQGRIQYAQAERANDPNHWLYGSIPVEYSGLTPDTEF